MIYGAFFNSEPSLRQETVCETIMHYINKYINLVDKELIMLKTTAAFLNDGVVGQFATSAKVTYV